MNNNEELEYKFIKDLLSLLYKYDDNDLMWIVYGDSIKFAINCNDLFYWATADAEDVTPETLPVLQKAYEDCARIGYVETAYAQSLYACRMRKMRPQGAAYPKNHPELWKLFDDAGPPRKTDNLAFGNPKENPI